MRRFNSFRLDAANQCLWDGEARVDLAPKVFGVLRYLVDHAGRLVTQNELLEALWPDTYVNPEVLRRYILEIRRVLGDRPDQPGVASGTRNAEGKTGPAEARTPGGRPPSKG